MIIAEMVVLQVNDICFLELHKLRETSFSSVFLKYFFFKSRRDIKIYQVLISVVIFRTQQSTDLKSKSFPQRNLFFFITTLNFPPVPQTSNNICMRTYHCNLVQVLCNDYSDINYSK